MQHAQSQPNFGLKHKELQRKHIHGLKLTARKRDIDVKHNTILNLHFDHIQQ